jgi:hypothetical protein
VPLGVVGITKGWALTHSIPERLYKAHLKNYLKMYYTIKAYLDTQNVRLLSFNMVPQDTTTVISMNIFWYKPVYRGVQSRKSKVRHARDTNDDAGGCVLGGGGCAFDACRYAAGCSSLLSLVFFRSARPQLFKPWTGWQSRWSRPPLTLWRPRLVQNLTNERKILQAETTEDIDAYSRIVQEQLRERRQQEEELEQQQQQQQQQL